MRFGDARDAGCNAGHVFGRAAAYPVTDQRGKRLVVGVRNVAVSLMRYRSSLQSARSEVGRRHRRSRSRTCGRHSRGKALCRRRIDFNRRFVRRRCHSQEFAHSRDRFGAVSDIVRRPQTTHPSRPKLQRGRRQSDGSTRGVRMCWGADRSRC
jgi:hypothetical protein